MARTLTIRKVCVRPQGTVECHVSNCQYTTIAKHHTVSVIMEVQKLIVPLSDNSQSIFEESYDNQEASNCWKISMQSIC